MSVLPTPVKDAAVQNNQRIFNTYEASLSNTTHYIEFAGKFALWLDSDRAFYAQGKPSIVSILMTAYRTVHRTICPQQAINDVTLLNMVPYKNHPLVLAYRHLIEVLSKYVKHFLDDAVLRPQVQFLLHTVGMQLNADTRPPISVQPSPIVQRPPAPVQTEREPPRASTSRAGSSQSPAPLSLPKKKRNFDLLIKQDLDWYASQNSSAPKTQDSAPANEPSLSKSPLTTNTETKLVPTSAPAGTASVRPSESTSTSGLAVTPQDNAFQTIIQVETKPVPQDGSSAASEIITEVESKPNVLGEWTVFRDAIPPESKPLSENGEIVDDGMEGVSEADETDQLQDDVPMASPQGMDIDDGSNEREEVANLLDTSTTSIAVNTDQGQIGSIPHEAEDSEMEGVGVHAGERSEAVLHSRGDIQEPSGTPHGRNENAYLSRHSTPADARNSLSIDAASHAGVPVEPANLRNVDEIQPQSVAVASPPPPDPIAQPVKEDLVLPSHDGFNNNMIRIWLAQGKDSPCEHKFNVEVTESTFVHFVNWNQRNKNAREVEKSKCISLCCYKTTDVATLMKRGARGLELMNSLCISWPQAGGLKLLVTIDGQQKMVPLSPPTVVTAGLLDLTLFLQVGNNEFVVVQERSMTEYVFMVFAHDPTRAQLEPVVDRRKKEEDWKTVLNHLSRPLELLPGPWD
ncbi:hypothetical protein ARMSODRAFT_946629 [Armillaria solidipes]|uniref:Uncharacterized protein n=1 Tax=Armillaria solidipes TaxID=1076256 RepID=A0A2H3CEX7_9AGAR|nr:hypothetical protein ARMSODRAFT_946629 [Armillaria solidipes]